jgi:hypothetical protein
LRVRLQRGAHLVGSGKVLPFHLREGVRGHPDVLTAQVADSGDVLGGCTVGVGQNSVNAVAWWPRVV